MIRVRLAPAGTDAYRVDLADPAGRPVASIGSLALRPIPARHADGPPDGLLRPAWEPLPALSAAPRTDRWVLVVPDGPGPGWRTHADPAALTKALDAGEQAPEVIVLPCPPAGNATSRL